MSRRCRSLMILSCLAGVLAAAPSDAEPARGLTSAPVDYSIYREGEVRRVEHQFGAWQLTCDEIIRLARKFCSLRGVARAVDGTIVASLAVSTDDRGQPAALVTLPFGTVLPSGLTVTRWDGSAKRKPVSAGLQPALCGGAGCQVIWPLRVDDIKAMSAGAKLQIAFRMKPAAVAARLLTFDIPTVPIEGTVMSDGFSDALQASLR